MIAASPEARQWEVARLAALEYILAYMMRPLLHCLRCLHFWFQKGDHAPKACARCNSPYWNTPRTTKRKGRRAKGPVPL